MVGGLTKRQWRLETFQRDRYWEDGFDSSHRYRHANDRKHYTYKIHPAFRFKCLLQIRFNLFLKLKLTYSKWVQLFFCPPYFPLKNLDALSMQIICSPILDTRCLSLHSQVYSQRTLVASWNSVPTSCEVNAEKPPLSPQTLLALLSAEWELNMTWLNDFRVKFTWSHTLTWGAVVVCGSSRLKQSSNDRDTWGTEYMCGYGETREYVDRIEHSLDQWSCYHKHSHSLDCEECVQMKGSWKNIMWCVSHSRHTCMFVLSLCKCSPTADRENTFVSLVCAISTWLA